MEGGGRGGYELVKFARFSFFLYLVLLFSNTTFFFVYQENSLQDLNYFLYLVFLH